MIDVKAQTRRTSAGALLQLFVSMRPRQWTKNLVVFLALLFSINLYWNPTDIAAMMSKVQLSIWAFVLFCALSGGIYLINDLIDLESDQAHPRKRHRPLASGRLSRRWAIAGAVVLLSGSLIASYALRPTFGVLAAVYVGMMVLYSTSLKHMVILDVGTIAAGFVVRAAAGAVAIHVPISPWLYLCTALGALFIGLAKRRHELLLLNDDAGRHRQILDEYTPALLDQMLVVVAASTVIAYSLYTFTAEGLPRNQAMMLTIPFVIYGVLRYLYLLHVHNDGGSPEETLLSDLPLGLDVVLWVLASAAILLVARGH